MPIQIGVRGAPAACWEPVEGTCTWVTEHPRYKDWVEEGAASLLWLSGDPGYGKSVIASFLITHLTTRRDAIVCYFFFKDDSEEQRSATFALCSILHQLFVQRNSLCIYAEGAFEAKGKRFTEEVDTLWNILVKAVSEGGVWRDSRTKDLELIWENPGGLEHLRSLLKSSADRTFLWVSLVLEILKASEDGSPGEFANIISTLPRDLAEFYTKILDKSTNPGKARRILSMVVAAARPLTLWEMNPAFRIGREHKATKDIGEPAGGFERIVRNYCGLSVRIIGSKVYLVHQTTREFLIKGSLPGQGN
ncbi:hypothetical protein C7212DRAFT_365485 [Tuber magnatum]|uniref:NACHT domain-containing protein n=1 Tax=Tuber magnatum TaxID=42249 RepID=A0A317SHD7_9PEZI|nr:hypothetical protein C7212DRAFT_365485 [Tuber magnatum]